MRWENLRVTEGEAARAAPPLPLALPGAVTRTFDTPGFAGMTFYEVRAKSIINRVPGQSRVPFEWTINPYRGCTHACVYCTSGDTPILMADGRTKPIADLTVGDRIYGTVRVGKHRRYTVTEVLAHWQTVKPAYRVTLADGTRLIASGDHRFLTSRGWKHVTGAEDGRARRPHLSTGNTLIGTGAFASPPKDSVDYRRGYLCGMIRGGADLNSRSHPYGEAHRFRLTLADEEALDRTRRYLTDLGAATSREADIAAIRGLSEWPVIETEDWRKGFLAGIFDAEGCYSAGVLLITDTDQETIGRTAAALSAFGFDHVIESLGPANSGRNVRLLGGLREHLRFFHTVDPAITRKRALGGTALSGDAPLGVVSIEPLGLDLPMFDITTGTGDFIANGVVSHNCFARHTHTYLDLDAGRDFDTRVVVKVNAGDLLRKELAAPRWRGEHIAMGTNVDCYQRAEGRYQLMREIIATLRDFANPFSILTKGTLITRDLDLLTEAAEVTDVGVSLSIGFVDETLWRSVEPGAPSPRRRLDTVRRLADAGFAVGVLMAPILPGLTDTDESIDATVRELARAGAVSVTPLSLHLRPGAREWYLAWLSREHPHLLPRYRELYGERAYLGSAYQREVAARVRLAARRNGIRGTHAKEARQVPTSPEEARALGYGTPTGRADTRTGGPDPTGRRMPPAGEQLTLL